MQISETKLVIDMARQLATVYATAVHTSAVNDQINKIIEPLARHPNGYEMNSWVHVYAALTFIAPIVARSLHNPHGLNETDEQMIQQTKTTLQALQQAVIAYVKDQKLMQFPTESWEDDDAQ